MEVKGIKYNATSTCIDVSCYLCENMYITNKYYVCLELSENYYTLSVANFNYNHSVSRTLVILSLLISTLVLSRSTYIDYKNGIYDTCCNRTKNRDQEYDIQHNKYNILNISNTLTNILTNILNNKNF